MLQLRLYTRLSILHEEIAGQLKKILLAQRVKVLGVVNLLHGKKTHVLQTSVTVLWSYSSKV